MHDNASSPDEHADALEDIDTTHLSAAFVCVFDVSKGNMVAWVEGATSEFCEGLEYKAIASGLHTLYEDYIYFKQNDLFGLALFHHLVIDSGVERGARMGSVGFLAPSITALHAQL